MDQWESVSAVLVLGIFLGRTEMLDTFNQGVETPFYFTTKEFIFSVNAVTGQEAENNIVTGFSLKTATERKR